MAAQKAIKRSDNKGACIRDAHGGCRATTCKEKCCGEVIGPPCPEGEICYYRVTPCPGTSQEIPAFVQTECFDIVKGAGGCLGIPGLCATVSPGPVIRESLLPTPRRIVPCADLLPGGFKCCECIPGCGVVQGTECCCSGNATVFIDWTLSFSSRFGPGLHSILNISGGGQIVIQLRDGVATVLSPAPTIEVQTDGLINGQPGLVTSIEPINLAGFKIPTCVSALPPYLNSVFDVPALFCLSEFAPDCEHGRGLLCQAINPIVTVNDPGFHGSCTFDDGNCYEWTQIDAWGVDRPDNQTECTVTWLIRVVEEGQCGGGCGGGEAKSIAREEWPDWADAAAWLAIPSDRGVGDTIERLARKTGIKWAADRWRALTGKRCRCSSRRHLWNRLYPYDSSKGRGT